MVIAPDFVDDTKTTVESKLVNFVLHGVDVFIPLHHTEMRNKDIKRYLHSMTMRYVQSKSQLFIAYMSVTREINLCVYHMLFDILYNTRYLPHSANKDSDTNFSSMLNDPRKS